jgi:hypothetical protein
MTKQTTLEAVNGTYDIDEFPFEKGVQYDYDAGNGWNGHLVRREMRNNLPGRRVRLVDFDCSNWFEKRG